MSFKTYEERKQAAEKMCEEGKGFQQLFQRAPFNKRVSFIFISQCFYTTFGPGKNWSHFAAPSQDYNS